jgi:transposase-like protein
MRRRRENVPYEKRMEIVRDYLTGNETAKEVGARYDVSPHSIHVWVYRYKREDNGEKNVSLPEKPKEETDMAKAKKTDPSEENALLKQRIRDLEAQLHQSELKNLALNTMIDIAEEQGIKIRKKSGAKQ